MFTILHNYSAQSITRVFRRTFALRGTKYHKILYRYCSIRNQGCFGSRHEVSDIEFKVTLPKHHEGIRAIELVIGIIKNTVSKSLAGPNLIKMDNEELQTWLVLVIQKINDRPFLLGAPQGITITPNKILHGFRNTHCDEINPETTVEQQLNRWKICLTLFGSLWIQEFTQRQYLVL